MHFLKAVGGERSDNVLDTLVERLERNSGTVHNLRRSLRVMPACPAERVNVDHPLFSFFRPPGTPEGNRFNRPQSLLRRVRLLPLSSGS